MRGARSVVVATLGTTQTLAWASSYYLISILADPMATSLGLPRAVVFGIFSGSLLISAVLGPAVGRAIDRRGGRGVLVVSNLVLAGGLLLLAAAQGAVTLALAWATLGVGMALGLYDSAFATLAVLYGRDARGAITGITLIAGFASTVGWPMTALFNDGFGWRGACLAWAVLHLVVALPLNLWLIPAARIAPTGATPTAAGTGHEQPPQSHTRALVLLAFAFAAAWFVTGAIAVHLPRLLQEMGATPAAAIAASTLLGPAQVGARTIEFGLLRKLHPIVVARLAASAHPIGAVALVLLGAPAAAVFAILHGAGNGLLTIARGTLPLAIFGPEGYGRRTGIIGAPARATQAASPLLYGLVLDNLGPVAALALSSALILSALAALLMLRPAAPEATASR